MHRYRHSPSGNETWDCRECGDKVMPSAALDNRKYANPKPSNDISVTQVVNRSSSQFDGVGLATQFDIPAGIITATTSEIPGYRIKKCMGTVVGMSTRSRGFFPTLGAEFKQFKGGKIGRYTELMYRTRKDAVVQMCMECQKLGGNAIVGMRFDAGQIEDAVSQACVYGTAMYIVKADAVENDEKSRHWI